MARRKRKAEEDETTYWLSYSDMMAALLLIFVLVISSIMLQAKAQYEQEQQKLQEQERELQLKEEEIVNIELQIEEQRNIMALQEAELERVIGLKGGLITALKDEFENSNMNVVIDAQTGAITFDSNILFDINNATLKQGGKDFLREFMPRYIQVLMDPEFRPYISEIIIEGHTDPSWDYFVSLELSQQRALAVARFCLSEQNAVIPADQIGELRSIITANGRSYSTPILLEDGTVDLDASRRVEIKFRLKDDIMIEEMINVLEQ